MTTYVFDLERNADEISQDELERKLKASGCNNLREIYDTLVREIESLYYEDNPIIRFDILYHGVTGRITNYRARLSGHYTDKRGQLIVMLDNGDKVILAKPVDS